MARSHGWPWVVQQTRERDGGHLRPSEFQSARILDPCRAGPLDAVDRAQRLRLGGLGGRAANPEPTAGVDHQQAAVCILKHVRRVKILVR